MTRKLLSFSLLFFALNGLSQTQIGNSGMETWTNLGATTEEPTNWNSFLSGQGGLVGFASQQVQRSAIVRAGATGTYSARVWAKSVLGIVANGNMTIGRINMGSSTPTNAAANYNISLQADANFSEAITDRPDSIVFWVRYTQAGGGVQNARMHAVLHDAYDLRDPIDANSTPHVVATAALNYPATAGAWVRKSVPFVYSGAASTVSYILLTFTTNQTPGGGAANDEVLIDDVELIYVPKPSFTPATATVCQGGTVNFTNTSTNYPTSYSWFFQGGSPATSTATNPSITYNTPGTYDVVLTATNQWGSKTITQTNIITVGATPSIPTISANGPTSFCSGSSVVLSSSQANGNTWSNTGTGAAITVSTSGTYTVTYTDALGCAATSAPTAVTVNTTPAAPTVSANGPTTFCTGGSVVLTSSQATGNVWSNSAGTGASITVTTSGSYSVTYTDGNGCSATSTPTSVSVSNAPVPTVSASALEVCSGDSIVLTSSAADSYVWSNGGGTTQSITVTTGGSYTVTVTNADACDGAGTSTPITVNVLPTPVASATYTINGNVVTFTNTTSNGTSYSWDFGDQSTSIDASPVHTFAANGTYTVVLTATGGNALTLCTDQTTINITISGVGLDEQTALTGVVASPNPFTTEVSFEGLQETVQFLLFDMAGKVIAESSLTPESSSVELLNLTSGVYFAHLTSSTGARQIVKLIRK